AELDPPGAVDARVLGVPYVRRRRSKIARLLSASRCREPHAPQTDYTNDRKPSYRSSSRTLTDDVRSVHTACAFAVISSTFDAHLNMTRARPQGAHARSPGELRRSSQGSFRSP